MVDERADLAITFLFALRALPLPGIDGALSLSTRFVAVAREICPGSSASDRRRREVEEARLRRDARRQKTIIGHHGGLVVDSKAGINAASRAPQIVSGGTFANIVPGGTFASFWLKFS